MSLYARIELSPEYFATEIPVDRHDPAVQSLLSDVPKNTVIATSTWYPSKDGIISPANALRAGLALQFCKNASALGYKTIVVDENSDAGWRQEIRSLDNVVLLDQKAKGFGPGRREGYEVAANDSRKVKVATEPEKHPLILHADSHSPLAVAALPVYLGTADGIVPRRIDGLASYPAQQAVAEIDAALSVYNIMVDYANRHGLDIKIPYLDQQIGPRIFNEAAMPYFLKYPGKFEAIEKVKTPEGEKDELRTYSHDVWQSHFVPFWHMILHGKKVAGVAVDYIHPPEQTKLESSDVGMDAKRHTQLVAVAGAARDFLRSYEQGRVTWV